MKDIPYEKLFKHDNSCFFDRKIIRMKEGKFKLTLNKTLPPEGSLHALGSPLAATSG